MVSSTHPPSAATNEPTPPQLPTAKLTAFSRFLSFRETLSRSATPKPDFPPPSWDLAGTKDNGAGATEWKYEPERWKQDILDLKDIIKAEYDDNAKLSQDPSSQAPASEPNTLAQKIKNLIENLPLPSSATPTPPSDSSQKPEMKRSPSGLVPDSVLRALLYSESVMNGVTSKSKESIFYLLDKMSPAKQAGTASPGAASDAEDDGVMLYAPLSPTPNSQPEIADSDVVYDDDDDDAPILEYVDDPQLKGKEPEKEKKPEKKQKTHREWHPSPTKLSLYATWWGYRLYLPPPVLAVLSDGNITAAKRGAMITAALKWLLDKIPLMMVPPPLRLPVMALKRMTPYLGYVGAVVAWSWEKVKSYDKGDGVVLTATWLLTVAVIPATWKPEVHGYPKAKGKKTDTVEGKKDAKVATEDLPSSSSNSTLTIHTNNLCIIYTHLPNTYTSWNKRTGRRSR